MTIRRSKRYMGNYFSLSFYSQNRGGEWLILILLFFILQLKLRGWVVDVDFIIISVILNNESYIFWYCILNVLLLFGSILCQLMDQIRPKTWNLLVIYFLSLFLIVLCVPVHENHKHVQGWNPTTTNYFPGRHNNNNNKHGEKPNNKLEGKVFVGEIPILNMFMIFINRKIWN